ncbi:hypothetical protein C8J56DRAFT_925039 [Mycena floridula]|nr:hypothetical protein C8J56DRAFT_925039 [Mycena floridula]
MVKSTAFALLLAVASLNVVSTLAVPVRISGEMVSAQRRDLDDSLTELARRAPTKGGAAPKPKANPVNTQNRNNPKAPGSNQKPNASIPKGKPAPHTPPKPASKPAAAYNKNELLRQEFSLEQARIGLEKQEQAWKPTLLRRDSEDFHLERRAPGGAKAVTKAPVANTKNTKKTSPNTAPKKLAPGLNKVPIRKPPVLAKPAASYDKNELLKQEFSLEQSRIGLEKQEQAWKPTLLRRDSEDFHLERRAPGNAKAITKAPAANTKNTQKTPIAKKPTPQTTKPTPNRQPSTPKPGKPVPNTQKPVPNTPKPGPKPGMTKPASTVDQNALLRQEFALEQSRIGLEKQEQAWKPTLLRRSFEESEIEELVARAPAGTAKSSTPKSPSTKPTTPSTKSTTPSTKGTGATAAKKEMPKDWYSNQYSAEEKKIKELSQRLKKNTNSHAELASQFKTEQENIKAMQEEFKWKPKTWSG